MINRINRVALNLWRTALTSLLFVLLAPLLVFGFNPQNQRDLVEIGRLVHGGTPLNPTSESLLGRYVAESGAVALVRSYAKSADAQPGDYGPERLFVSITRQSFPIFQKYFSSSSLLMHYHIPQQNILEAAFKGYRGDYARLQNELYFSYPGVLLLPVLLTPAESGRAESYFLLAERATRWFDFAIHPWILKNVSGIPYREPGNRASCSDWFLEMPLGESAVVPRVAYDRARVYADAAAEGAPIENPSVYELLESVWSAPLGHPSLGEVLNLSHLNLSTAGRTAQALLGSTGIDRLPVVFRLVENHSDLNPEIELWIRPLKECR